MVLIRRWVAAQVLAALHGVHALLVALNVLAPRLHVAGGGIVQAWSIIALNAMNLAVACRCALLLGQQVLVFHCCFQHRAGSSHQLC